MARFRRLPVWPVCSAALRLKCTTASGKCADAKSCAIEPRARKVGYKRQHIGVAGREAPDITKSSGATYPISQAIVSSMLKPSTNAR